MTAQEVIELLDLEPHPREGGYFRETYRTRQRFPAEQLAATHGGPRAWHTAIYFLITPESFSRMHRVAGDELFHHYLGDAVELLLLMPGGDARTVRLGTDLARGARPQVLAPGGVWQGARLAAGGRFALLGTTMTPGFDYADYEDGDRRALVSAYPQERARIEALTFGG